MKSFLTQRCSWRSLLQRFLLGVTVIVLAIQLNPAAAWATGVYEVPRPAAGTWVVDRAEVLSRTNEGKINTQLDELAKQTGNEVHILSIRRLDYGETIESFTNKLFEKWFPTSEAQANQTLLVIDNLTNNTAVRAGEQVKSVLSDAIATSIAQETVLIPLKDGNKYNQALLAASDRLTAVLSGEPDPGPPEVKDTIRVEGTFATPEQTKSSNAMVWVVGFLAVATIVPMATYYLYLYVQSR